MTALRAGLDVGWGDRESVQDGANALAEMIEIPSSRATRRLDYY
jgi:hypothetical protein